MSQWTKLETIRTDDQAKFIYLFLKRNRYNKLEDYYPDAKYSETNKLLMTSANSVIEKINGTLQTSEGVDRQES